MYLTKYRPFIITIVMSLAIGITAPIAVATTFDTIETSQTVQLSNFKKVYIAPVRIELKDERIRRNIRDISSDRPVSDLDKERKAQDSYEDIVNAFDKNFEIADAPGPDVLTVEAIVTKLSSSRPTLADFELNTALSFNSVYAGAADFQVRLSQNDKLLTEIKDSTQSNFNDGLPRIGVWQDYNRISNRFARKLAAYVKGN